MINNCSVIKCRIRIYLLCRAYKRYLQITGLPMPEEKRRFTRVHFRVSAEIMVHDFSCRAEEILNLSVGGCLIPVKEDLEPGTECHLKIIMTGTTSELSIRLKGEIIRCNAGAVAVKFTGIDPDSLVHLQNIIRYNSFDPEVVDKEIRDHPGLV